MKGKDNTPKLTPRLTPRFTLILKLGPLALPSLQPTLELTPGLMSGPTLTAIREPILGPLQPKK